MQPLRHYPARRRAPALGLGNALSVHLACAKTSPQLFWLTAEREPAWNAPSEVRGGHAGLFKVCWGEKMIKGGTLSCCQAPQAPGYPAEPDGGPGASRRGRGEREAAVTRACSLPPWLASEGLGGRVCPGWEVGAESPPQSSCTADVCVLEIKVTNAARASTSSL